MISGGFGSFLLGVGVTALGWLVVHHLNKVRDRGVRRSDFLKMMGQWRTRVYRCADYRKVAADFPELAARFGGEYIALERDLRGAEKRRFHQLCDQIIAMTDGEVERSRPELLSRIEAIIALLS